MPASAEIDQALIARLEGDAVLAGLLQPAPNIFFDLARENSTKFIVLSLASQRDELEFGGRGIEEALYLIQARGLSTAATEVQMDAIEARLGELLEGADLVIEGYASMVLVREARIRNTEPDDVNPAIRYRRRGGYYRVMVGT